MGGSIRIETPDANSLLLRKSRADGIRDLIIWLGAYASWYSFLRHVWPQLWPGGLQLSALAHFDGWVALFQRLAGGDGWLLPLVLLALLCLPQLLAAARASIWGWSLLLDGSARAILQGGRRKALFGDVRAVKITTISDEGGDEYLASVILTDAKSLFITQSSDRERITMLAADIARVLNTQIVKQ